MEQHSGHRDRLRERFMTNSLAGFAPHEVLELLLFYAIPRRDTNALAHALIDRFGSFDRVLEAPAEELMQVPGIGRHCAVLLNTVFACFRYYNQSKQRSRFVATSTAAVMEYVQSLYFGETAEVCYLLCFDMRMRLLCCTVVLPVRLPFWARMAPPKPQAALMTAQLRIRATTRPAPRWCFLGCAGVFVTTGSAAGSTMDPAADSA